ncbi:hypothetical protein BCR33DRAFT_769752 [Rhizoclosmatium globosum]|uniref:Uncharacterized protein n=1 Tax=Rhizoclosmatium globosum TaxID=329046 RepID=A0A1Y2BSK0_9FUNG|nr:hypothetical protein BCR33DRAFT_769752 [Rhizoclosmatium globosum]|eukprot:ORY37684.1 hypothetical protein BCR33DRAFT_769752 [Rhizoclosmatium globosum]
MSQTFLLTKNNARQQFPSWRSAAIKAANTIKPIKGFFTLIPKERHATTGQWIKSTSNLVECEEFWDHAEFGFHHPSITEFQMDPNANPTPSEKRDLRDCKLANNHVDAALTAVFLASVDKQIHDKIINSTSAHDAYIKILDYINVQPEAIHKHLRQEFEALAQLNHETCHDYIDRAQTLIITMEGHNLFIPNETIYSKVCNGFTLENQEHVTKFGPDPLTGELGLHQIKTYFRDLFDIYKGSSIQRKETRSDDYLHGLITKWPGGVRPSKRTANSTQKYDDPAPPKAPNANQTQTPSTSRTYKKTPCAKCGSETCGFVATGVDCPKCPENGCYGHLPPCNPFKIAKFQKKQADMKQRNEANKVSPTIYSPLCPLPLDSDSDEEDSEMAVPPLQPLQQVSVQPQTPTTPPKLSYAQAASTPKTNQDQLPTPIENPQKGVSGSCAPESRVLYHAQTARGWSSTTHMM